VIILEARYGPVTLKHGWDYLPQNIHLASWGGWLGQWITAHWDTIRHVYGRNVPEGIIGLAGVLIILAKAKPAGEPKRIDRILVRVGFPNHHQGQLGRHERVSALQVAMLLPTMLIASVPGVIAGSVLIYGSTALLHHYGVHLQLHVPGVLVPYLAGATWQPLAIGALGGWFFARKSTSKVADDVQLYFEEIRLARARAIDKALSRYSRGAWTLPAVRERLDGLRRARPARIYPPVFRYRYDALLNAGADPEPHGTAARWAMPLAAGAVVVLGLFGAYIRLWYAKHGGWIP